MMMYMMSAVAFASFARRAPELDAWGRNTGATQVKIYHEYAHTKLISSLFFELINFPKMTDDNLSQKFSLV